MSLRIAEIWRYPVKSLGGEPVHDVEVGETGVLFDRHWGIQSEETGLVLTARRCPELLFASASVVGGECAITLPDGRTSNSDADLSKWLGRGVRLVEAGAGGATFEAPLDDLDEAGGWGTWDSPTGTFHDSGRALLSLVSSATLGVWDRRRFRINVILDGDGEDTSVGAQARVGSQVVVRIDKAIGRCVMVTRPQPGLERDLDVLRTVNRERRGTLGVGALVIEPGTIRVGDLVTPASTP